MARAARSSAGLEVERVERFAKTHPLDDWLARTGCAGADAERVRELLAVLGDDGAPGRAYIVVKARKSQR